MAHQRETDAEAFVAMLVRASIGFVMRHDGMMTTVQFADDKPRAQAKTRPVFSFNKITGALCRCSLVDVTDL